MPTISELQQQLSEIQGNVLRSYRAKFASYRFYRFQSSSEGKDWLKALLKEKKGRYEYLRITTSEAWPEKNGKREGPPFTLNLAFTHAGLQALELPTPLLQSFPEEFKEGMYKRAVTVLGDEPLQQGDNGTNKKNLIPKHWDDEFRPVNKPGSEKEEEIYIHALLILTSQTKPKRDQGLRQLRTLEKDFPKVKLLDINLEGEALTGEYDRKEHFGFVDGISQPFIEGTEDLYTDKDNNGKRLAFPGQGIPVIKSTLSDMNRDVFLKGQQEQAGKLAHWKHIKPGEFLLGYEDELGEVAHAPEHEDLKTNGTYLVLRKLEQNVLAFNEFIEREAQTLWSNHGSKKKSKEEREKEKELLAAKLMGRWKNGCPLAHYPEEDKPAPNGQEDQKINDFLYHDDPNGMKCPLGAHIRRTNPRDQLPAVAMNFHEPAVDHYHLNRHRILRRGLTYGPVFPKPGKRGVIFMALNASIDRQFEFVQQQWVNDGDFLGLDRTERDPFIGKKDDGKAKMTVPGATEPYIHGLKRFVTERGGEYFFYPSMKALRKLATGKFEERSNFVSEFEALNSMPGVTREQEDQLAAIKMRRAAEKQRLVARWLRLRPKEMFDHLRNTNPVFFVEPVIPPEGIPDLQRPPIVILSRYRDVIEILENREQVFSVMPYTLKMMYPRGPFILGMDEFREHHDPHRDLRFNYYEELSILHKAIPSEDLEQRIRPLLETLTVQGINRVKAKGTTLDVIHDLAWPVPIGLIREYFGVSHSDDEVLKGWVRDIFKDLFLNMKKDEQWVKEADQAVEEMNHHLDDLIESTLRKIQRSQNVPDTVLSRLVRMQYDPETRFPDKFGVRRNMMGILVGIVETTLKATSRALEQLYDFKHEKELKAARQAAIDNNDPLLSKYVFEAMRFNPQNPLIPRVAIKPYTFAKDTPEELTIAPGTVVFAGTLGAMFDPEKIKNPEEFRIHRPELQWKRSNS